MPRDSSLRDLAEVRKSIDHQVFVIAEYLNTKERFPSARIFTITILSFEQRYSVGNVEAGDLPTSERETFALICKPTSQVISRRTRRTAALIQYIPR